MRRLLLDTNVLIDFLSVDRPAHEDARRLFELALRQHACRLYALASSLKDVYFVYERHYGSEALARQGVRLLGDVLELCGCDAELVWMALASDEPDFEDGLVRCAAEQAGLDGIVTRNKPSFVGSRVDKLSVPEAVELCSKGD